METINRSDSTGIYILCGGASSRMGRSKVDINVHGRPMITHILDTVSTLSSPVFLVGKPSQKTTLSQYGHTFISDHATTFHPLNGVVTGLEHKKESFEHVLFCPVTHHLFLQSSARVIGTQSFRCDGSIWGDTSHS